MGSEFSGPKPQSIIDTRGAGSCPQRGEQSREVSLGRLPEGGVFVTVPEEGGAEVWERRLE